MNTNMKRKKVFTAICLTAGLLLTACSQDDVTDGNALPEGQYPLQIASVAVSVEGSEQAWGDNAPQTRVSENVDRSGSMWEVGDIISVKPDGVPEAGTFRVTDINGTVETVTSTYWTKTTENVTAWFPAEETVSLADQNTKLAYVLQATATNAAYNQPISLKFIHQLAKVRVVLRGDQADKVTNIKIKSLISCTHTQGKVSTESVQEEDWITMMHATYNGTECWEANVMPDHPITEFQVNSVSGTLSNGIIPSAAKVNTITLTVVNKEITGGETITDPGDYVIKGNITKSVTLNGNGINLTLDNVQLKTDDAPLIISDNAQVTLNIIGTTNSLTSTNGNGIEIRQDASLTITGNGKSLSKLVVNASDNSNPDMELKAGIGSSTGNVSIKTINISNVHLVVSGGKTGRSGNGPAAIGLCSVNGKYNQSCEGISITDSKIEATSYGGACIGTGSVSNDVTSGGEYNLGPITITNSEITATANGNRWGDCGSCIGFGYIGADASGVIKGITITNTTLNLTVTNSNAYKVGRGNTINNASYSITNSIIIDGQNKGNEGWNP